MSKLPDDKTIYLYCYSGQTAGQTTALLNVAGFDVKSVRYGFSLGISKVEGYEEVIETTPTSSMRSIPKSIQLSRLQW